MDDFVSLEVANAVEYPAAHFARVDVPLREGLSLGRPPDYE